MMNLKEVFAKAKEENATLSLTEDGRGVKWQSASGPMSPELRDGIKANKADILAALTPKKEPQRPESAYSKLLRDPRWQKKRLEIMQAAGFKCQWCGCTDQELNVHHHWYEHGVKPWEYDKHCYCVLCNVCHKKYHNAKYQIERAAGYWKHPQIIESLAVMTVFDESEIQFWSSLRGNAGSKTIEIAREMYRALREMGEEGNEG